MRYIVERSISINAKPNQVWDALTDPEKTKEYFFNCKVFSSWKKGGSIAFKGKMFWFIPIELTGQIIDVEPEKLLQYNIHNANDVEGKSISTVTDVLTYKDGVTTITVTDDVGQGKGAHSRFKKSDKGWDKILKGLKELVEGMSSN